MERHERMNEKREEELRRSDAMRGKHQQQVVNQLNFEKYRENSQFEMFQQQREAKAVVRCVICMISK